MMELLADQLFGQTQYGGLAQDKLLLPEQQQQTELMFIHSLHIITVLSGMALSLCLIINKLNT
jgi:hypothetical protein